MSDALNKNKLAPSEIDIVAILAQIWKKKRILFLCLGISIFIGLFIAFSSPKQFKVVSVILPQSDESKGLSGFSSLAAIAGFDLDLGSGGGEISPVIYPQMMESESLLLELMYSKYSFKDIKQPITLYDYLVKYSKPSIYDKVKLYTIGLPSLIKESIKKSKNKAIESDVQDGFTTLTKEEYSICQMLSKSVTLTINKKEGYLTLTSIFDEASLSAQVAKKALDLLQANITEIKTKRAKDQLEFIQNSYKEKKAEYLNASRRVASYKDRNMFVSTSIGSSEETKLENEYTLSYSVYSELAKQLETAKIRVKQTTPVFLVIKPIVVPLEPFAPRKSIILLASCLIGIVVGCLIIFAIQYMLYLKQKQRS